MLLEAGFTCTEHLKGLSCAACFLGMAGRVRELTVICRQVTSMLYSALL